MWRREVSVYDYGNFHKNDGLRILRALRQKTITDSSCNNKSGDCGDNVLTFAHDKSVCIYAKFYRTTG